MTKRVLIIEDTEEWQKRHTATFKQLQFDEIIVEGDLEKAIEIIETSEEPFDIITIDMNLQGDITSDPDDPDTEPSTPSGNASVMGLEILKHISLEGRGEKCFIISAEKIGFSALKVFAPYQASGLLVDTYSKMENFKLELMREVKKVLREQESNRVFISYRRSDSASITGRLYEHLTGKFGQDKIFKDVDNIAPGDHFPEILQKQLEQCQVLLVVIGNYWLVDKEGKKRLHEANDWVRTEIITALKRKIRVIPVLVEGASLPDSMQLPVELRPLTENQTSQLRQDPDFKTDVQNLINAINKVQAAK